jgi:hypothetical protein
VIHSDRTHGLVAVALLDALAPLIKRVCRK